MGNPGGGGTPGGGGPFGAAIADALMKTKMFKILFGGILMFVKINKKSFGQNFF